MVIVDIIERITLSYDEDDDIIKMYENLDGWKKTLGDTTYVTFECMKSACFTSDDYRKAIMDE